MIPKKIHIYWNDDNIPSLIIKCINNIKKINNDFIVKIYTEKDIPFKISKNTIHQYKSDIFRLYILYKEGGIYVDASSIFIKNISKFIDLNDDRLQTYKTFKGTIIENWFLVSQPKNPLIYQWLKEELIINKITPKLYIKYYKNFINKYIDKQLPYLVNFLAFNISYYKLFNNTLLNDNKYYKSLGIAQDNCNPLSYLKENNWNSKKSINFLLTKKYDINNIKYNFIKLRSEERNYLIQMIKEKKYMSNSILINLLEIN